MRMIPCSHPATAPLPAFAVAASTRVRCLTHIPVKHESWAAAMEHPGSHSTYSTSAAAQVRGRWVARGDSGVLERATGTDAACLGETAACREFHVHR